jgi:MYXO-CTERM domain-containing protein
VTVSADIQDISGVTSAVLQYNIDGGAWNNVTMTSVGTTYSATIPEKPVGAIVTYRIVAYDTVGNEAVSPTSDYEVQDVVTTPTTPTEPTTTEPTEPTGPPGPGPRDDEAMLMVYGAFGALVVIVLALGARRRK